MKKKENPNENESYFELSESIKFDYDDNETINELFNGEFFGKKSSIAFVDGVDVGSLKSKRAYASKKDYRETSPDKNELTNERVKIELMKSYLQNPREYTSQIISSIFKEVETYYSLSKEDEKYFTEQWKGKGVGARGKLIDDLNQRKQKGDEKLVNALEASAELMKTLNMVENRHNKSFSTLASNKLNELTENTCFNSFDSPIEWTKVSPSEKKELFDLARPKENGLIDENKIEDILSKYVKSYYHGEVTPTDIKIERTKNYTEEQWDKISEDEKKKIDSYLRNKINKYRANASIKEAKGTFLHSVSEMDKVYKQVEMAIKTSSDVNSNVRKVKEFTAFYELMSDVTNIYAEKDEISRNYKIKKLQRDMREQFNQGSDEGSIRALISDAEKSNRKLHSDNNINYSSLLTKNNPTEQEFKAMAVGVLNHVMNKHYIENEIKNEASKKIATEQLMKLSSSMLSGKEKRKDGKLFSWGEMVGLYDKFQENNIMELTKANIQNMDIDSNTKKELLESIKLNSRTAYTPSGSEKEKIVETMNLHNIMNNEKIIKDIDSDEIDDTLDQSLTNDTFKEFGKAVYDKKKQYKEQSKDMTHDARIREVAGHYYSNYANSLLQSSILSLTSKRDTFQNFSSCVKGASVLQRNMDTKISNTTNCLKEFKNNLKKDAEDMQRLISSSASGVGALNPFLHLAQITAISRRLMAEEVENDMRKIADSINGISREVATAETEIERRARNTILMAKTDGNINIQTVHDSHKDSLAEKLKQEYTTREVVDFKESSSKVNDIKVEDILKSWEIKEVPTQKEIFEDESQILNDDFLSQMQGAFDGKNEYDTLEQEKNSENAVSQNKDDALSIENGENESNADFDNIGSGNTYVDIDVEVEKPDIDVSSLKNANAVNQIKENAPYKYNSQMMANALVKMDLIQKKMTELKLVKDNGYNEKQYKNGVTSGSDFVRYDKLGFSESDESDKKSLGLEEWESEELKDWMLKNDISKELLESTLEKGFDRIEQEKLALNYEIIVKSLEELNEDSYLAKLTEKQEYLVKEVESLDGDERNKVLLKIEKIENKIDERINDRKESGLRPKAKMDDIIKEMKGLFSEDGESRSKLSKRNSLSSAVNILLADSDFKDTMQTVFNTSSLCVDVEKRDKNSEMNIMGTATRDKAYLLKVLQENKMKNSDANESLDKDRLNGFDIVDYSADKELLKGTKEAGSESSLDNWSDLMSDSTDFSTFNKGVAENNTSMAQINDSKEFIVSDKETFTAPSESEYNAPS